MKHQREDLPIDDISVRYYDGSAVHNVTDRIIREQPVDIFINGAPPKDWMIRMR